MALLSDLPRYQELVRYYIGPVAEFGTSYALPPKAFCDKKDKASGRSELQLNPNAAPLSTADDWFSHLAEKLLDLKNNSYYDHLDVRSILQSYSDEPLRVVTMCSGTESPILAMKMIQKAFKQLCVKPFEFVHLASAEIEPFKQAYIRRNFGVETILQDVVEFVGMQELHTAYGGITTAPENVNLLIAGASCVDYSTLNHSRKKFGEKGKSYDTMHGIREYAGKYRPNIVILENVKNAPWLAVGKFWREIGYATKHVIIDTKNYGLPQTRQRGYLIAFDTRRAKAGNSGIVFDFEEAKDRWTKLMIFCQHRATSPFSDFLFPEDDPYIQKFKQFLPSMKDVAVSKRMVDWALCRHRYHIHRVTHGLGFKRPMTRWQNNGTCQFPDFGWQQWGYSQRERIWDTLDINFLSYVARRNYDMNFKHRWVQLSQNVDRDDGSEPWGIVSCLTPGGMPYLTSRGGPASGRECLALQGLPLKELSLNTETSRQLQDLAGNAMSTTVVGVAILSALCAARPFVAGDSDDRFQHSIIQSFHQDYPRDQYDTLSKEPIPALRTNEILSEKTPWTLRQDISSLGGAKNLRTESFLTLASQTMPLCKCEGFSGLTTQTIKQCETCGHTACLTCAGNPPHHYRALSSYYLQDRLTPDKFTTSVNRDLPRGIRLTGFAPGNISNLTSDLDDAQRLRLQKCVSTALHSDFYISAIKRESSWRVLYDSSHARLELHLVWRRPQVREMMRVCASTSVSASWYLFAKPPKEEYASSKVRDILRNPIARMLPGEFLLEGLWEIWQPKYDEVELYFSGEGELIKSWESSIGLQDPMFIDLKRYPVVEAHYRNSTAGEHLAVLKRFCGKYQLLPDCGTASGSLHRLVDSQSGSGEAMFMFLDPKPIGNAIFDQMTFSSDPRRLCDGDYRPKLANLQEQFRPVQSHMGHSSDTARPVSCFIIEDWQPISGSMVLQDNFDIGRWLPISLPAVNIDRDHCKSFGSTILLLELPLEEKRHMSWGKGEQTNVKLQDQPSALAEFSWLLRPVADLWDLNHWQAINFSQDQTAQCYTCAPRLPTFRWLLRRKRIGEAVLVMPVENAVEATQYEKALRERPSPIEALIHRHEDTALLQIRLNLAPVTHQVLARLQPQTAAPGLPVSARWCIARDPGDTVPISLGNMSLQSNDGDSMFSKSAMVNGVSTTYTKPDHFVRDLWDLQRKTLHWMLLQESNTSEWDEVEREEVNVQALEWRVDVEASRRVIVRGGVLADEVGGGKTTTSIALVSASMKDGIRPPLFTDGQKILRTNATLILVPKNILGQWNNEIQQCVGKHHLNVIKIETIGMLRTLRAQNIAEADIVLASWDLFDKEEYWKTLRWLVSAENTPLKAGRGFQHWQADALEDLGPLIRGWGGRDNATFWATQGSLEHQPARYAKYVGFSKTFEKKKRPDSQEKQLREAIPSWFSEKTIVPLLLHMFAWKRLIVDEVTYLQGKSLLATIALKADRRWMLSGTPPITDFDSINTLARLLGTKVASEAEKDGVFSFVKSGTSVADDKTYAEQFRELQVVRSTPFVNARRKQATKFVKQFIRQNPAPAAAVRRHDHYRVIELSVIEKLIFFPVYQKVISSTIKFGATMSEKSMKELAFQPLLDAVVSTSESREDALITCCHQIQMLGRGTEMYTETFVKKMIMEEEDTTMLAMKSVIEALRAAFGFISQGRETEEENPHLWAFFRNILENRIGDPCTAKFVSQLIWYAEGYPWLLNDYMMPRGVKKLTTKKAEEKAAIEPETDAEDDLKVGTEDDLENDTEEDLEGDVEEYLEPGAVEKLEYKSNADPFSEVEDEPAKEKTTTRALTEAQLVKKKENRIRDLRLMEAKRRSTVLLTWTEELLESMRRARVLYAVLEIVCGKGRGEFSPCLQCERRYHYGNMYVNGLCGHIACFRCFNDPERLRTNPDGCIMRGCTSSGRQQHQILASEFQSDTPGHSDYGSKMTAVVGQIRAIPQDEFILIFVRSNRLTNHLIQVLNGEDIPFIDATKDSRRKVEKFRKGSNERVCILKVDSADAAGWNLQIANHVIFVSALVTRTQYEYDSIMKQAVGRAFRFGQQKDVHVYHFLMAKTLEVNILQDRNDKVLVKRNGDYVLVDKKELSAGEQRFDGPVLDAVDDADDNDGNDEDAVDEDTE